MPLEICGVLAQYNNQMNQKSVENFLNLRIGRKKSCALTTPRTTRNQVGVA